MVAEAEKIIRSSISVWENLSKKEKDMLIKSVANQSFLAKETVHFPDSQCAGIVIVKKGRLRVYMLSEDGRELNLFYIEAGDFCIFTASCILNEIQFGVFIDADLETEVLTIPSRVVYQLEKDNLYFENMVYKKLAMRFSTVMCSMQHMLFNKINYRLAKWLLDQNMDIIKTTHEEIAKKLNTAREVVSRTLKGFADKKLISLGRGQIKILDRNKLLDM